MNEKTLIKTVSLPHGREWEWYGDLNIVALSPCLDAEGRERALGEVQDHWRRSCLRVVGDSDPLMATQPVQLAPQLSVPPRASATIRGVMDSLPVGNRQGRQE